MNDLPPFRALLVFDVVGRCSSMKRAADELGVSPGAVSQQIKILEEALGLQLVARNTAGLRLTEFGERYHRETSRILADLRRTHRELAATRASSGLIVSGLPLLTSKWLAPRMLEWQALHPDISLHLEGSIIEPSLESGQVDFRISYRDRIRHFESGVPLYTDSLVPVCSPDLLRNGSPLESPGDLALYRLLTIDWKPLLSPSPSWKDWFASAGVTPSAALRDTFVFSLSSLAIEAAIDGRGVALAQSSLVSEDIRAGRLVVPFSHRLMLPSPYFLAWRAGVFDKHGARDFQRWLIGLARSQDHPPDAQQSRG
ncbi:LysR substrate-binding domain-containing protein [Bradyrhizobium sp. NP1]|uniref:LysR substrate-binding domain-containing protein n=1 Tax=Bradyrhizobium sp. NP1 TaxID=3049772 RepID=UPI0025A553BC|nr:LysR substrate-binding domain-containing protein [Bradyrhizobium sp. NP1]WJR80384.1 LysR substrate-binding domain-containing protein [Bradyrhizobium sp. NP1]